MRELAEFLRKQVDASGKTLTMLAREMHMSRTTISERLAGRSVDEKFVSALLTATIAEQRQRQRRLATALTKLRAAAQPKPSKTSSPQERLRAEFVHLGDNIQRITRLLEHSPGSLPDGVWFDAGELSAHWDPRARGAEQGRAGWYFTGRHRALSELVSWLSGGAPDGRVRVVTGGPGSGKSTVLARIVTLADPDLRKRTPVDGAPDATVPPTGCVDLAVLARGRSVSDVLDRIAAVAGIDLTSTAEAQRLDVLAGLLPAWPAELTVVVDALDEAADPEGLARALRRLARDVSGLRVLVGTRPGPRNSLLTACGHDARIIDLDCRPWLDLDDLAEYVRRRLLAADDPHTRSPYRNQPDLAARVAEAVAERAYPTFLIAQLVSRTLTDSDTVVDPSGKELSRLPGTVADALDDYLFRLGPDHHRVRDLLLPLAYAHGTGLARDTVWVELASAVAQRTYTLADLEWLLSTAADFLVEQTVDQEEIHYRLYHQALVDYLRLAQDDDIVERRITRVLTGLAPISESRPEWAKAPTYVRRYLSRHAAAARLLDPLLDDAGLLLAAEYGELSTALSERNRHLTKPDNRSTWFRRVLPQPGEEPPRRAALLEQSARQFGFDRLADDVPRVAPHRSWATPWAHLGRDNVTDVHGCCDGNIHAATVVEVDGEPTLVHSGHGNLVVRRLSDGRRLARLGADNPYSSEADFGDDWFAHLAWVYGDGRGAPNPSNQGGTVYVVTSGQVAGETYVVAGGYDGAVRLWHLCPAVSCETHERTRAAAVDRWKSSPLFSGASWIQGAAVVDGARPMVVAAELSGHVHFLDLATGSPAHPSGKHPGVFTRTMTQGTVGGQPVVLTGGSTSDGQRGCVQMWDPVTGLPIGEPMLHDDEVRAVTVTTLHGLTVAVTRTYGGHLSIWDLATRRLIRCRSTGLLSTWGALALTEIAGRRVLVFGTQGGFDTDPDGRRTMISGFRIDLVDLTSLEHLDHLRINSEVLSVTAAEQFLVVGCMCGTLALRCGDALVP
ncbi:hypothetical protein AQI88_41690 [Streptomyces cellostaticus]|uniref:Uncharacterized protein n=1 Tax=Streptomyces cellostaticus TaxID=67285 RepID=A0A117PPU8_9ACTN|nr:hypothetical protein [Streptomyces cellostaticus]KUM85100.1 hypothetical protein AQI88_41690 [Streptomyces cellostaticus]GHI10066.1 hypothetical protein Scel_83870 [Streptomyces cellostaticus]